MLAPSLGRVRYCLCRRAPCEALTCLVLQLHRVPHAVLLWQDKSVHLRYKVALFDVLTITLDYSQWAARTS